ncbi:MAG: hypothetical protein IJH87_02935 [Atopobiaceae bacterium]|nr:hypothetical protein [Atopobiaceae bacterium]
MIVMTFTIGMLALSIGLHAFGFAMRCLGGIMRFVFGMLGLLLMPLALVCALVWGLGRIVLPILFVAFVLQMLFGEVE